MLACPTKKAILVIQSWGGAGEYLPGGMGGVGIFPTSSIGTTNNASAVTSTYTAAIGGGRSRGRSGATRRGSTNRGAMFPTWLLT